VRERRGDVGHVIRVELLERALGDREVVALRQVRRAGNLEPGLLVLGRLVGQRPLARVLRLGLVSLEQSHWFWGARSVPFKPVSAGGSRREKSALTVDVVGSPHLVEPALWVAGDAAARL